MAGRVPIADLRQVGAWLASQYRQRRLKAGVWYQLTFQNGYAGRIQFRRRLSDHNWPTGTRFLLVFTGDPSHITSEDSAFLEDLTTRRARFEPVLVDVVFNHIARKGHITLYSTRARKGFRFLYGQPDGEVSFTPPVELR